MIIDDVDAPVDGSLRPTLSGTAYTDPSLFVAEQRTIFEAMWFCAIRSDEIPKAGDFRTVQVGTESIIVSRSRGGEARAFFNVCRHRGMRVCLESEGSVRKFQCGYHAWTYNLDGTLIAAPNLTSMPDVDREDYGLKKVSVREWLGYIWVCLAEEPPSFEETVLSEVSTRLGEVENLDAYGVEKLALGKRITYDVKANWKLIIENFMECYHCATIHPELTAVLPEFADGVAAQALVNHGAEFGEDIEGFTVDGSAGVTRLPSIAPGQDRKYYAITVRPQVFVNMVPDHVILHRMFPVAPDHTIVECDWLYLPEVVESGVDLEKSVELFHRVNQQDFAACENTQPAMSSRVYTKGGALVPVEHHIADFHEWVSTLVGAR